MKKLLSGVVAAAIVAVAWPAWSQSQYSTTQGQSTKQNAPGTGGPSKPGVSGLPGGESGPTVTRSGHPWRVGARYSQPALMGAPTTFSLLLIRTFLTGSVVRTAEGRARHQR